MYRQKETNAEEALDKWCPFRKGMTTVDEGNPGGFWTDEEVVTTGVDTVKHKKVIPNLRWIVPLALDRSSDGDSIWRLVTP